MIGIQLLKFALMGIAPSHLIHKQFMQGNQPLHHLRGMGRFEGVSEGVIK